MDTTGHWTLWLLARAATYVRRLHEWRLARIAKHQRETQVKAARSKKKERVAPRIEPLVAPVEPSVRAQKERQVPLFDLPTDASGLPPLGLLDEPPKSRHTVSHAALEAMSRQVELKLGDFGIEVQVVAVHPGPVITRFELQPAPVSRRAVSPVLRGIWPDRCPPPVCASSRSFRASPLSAWRSPMKSASSYA